MSKTLQEKLAEAHKPGVRVGESVPVKKMVGKVRI